MGDFGSVLGGDDDRVDPRGPSVNVLNAHLRLPVRSEVIENLLFPDLRELPRQLVGVHDRHRHKLFGLCGRVAEHHALVSGSACIDSLSDVWGLAVNGRDHPAGFAVKAELGPGIPDLSDRLPNNLWKLAVPVGRYLSGDHHKAGCGKSLNGDAGVGILSDQTVQNGVGDLVGHLVGMPFRDGF